MSDKKKPRPPGKSETATSTAAAERRQQKLRGGRARLSHHKPRGRWFQARSAWPVREAPVHTLIRERERAAKSLPPATATGVKWECVGPMNVGGRITSLICHPEHPERIWVGAAGGGVWRSNDAGHTWESCWSDQDILNIGALAIDPNHPDVIYCGTGEANLSADSYPGAGLYKSIDGGKTWQLIASSEKNVAPKRIGR